MTLYRRDIKLQKAIDLIDNLSDSEENELIKYYIQKKDEQIKKQSIQLEEYRDWFNKLDRFLPNKNIVYK